MGYRRVIRPAISLVSRLVNIARDEAARHRYAVDWGMTPNKRWAATAIRQEDGSYLLDSTFPVADPLCLFDSGEAVSQLVGVDFVLGLPTPYAQMVGVTSFRAWLRSHGRSPWCDIYKPAANRPEISPHRPFYPAGSQPGLVPLHIVQALGVPNIQALMRLCEQKPHVTHQAQCLFYTRWSAQVGKGSLAGWRELTRPVIAERPNVRMWPHQGALPALLDRGSVLAETYPRQMYGYLGLATATSKKDHAWRCAQCPAIIGAAARVNAILTAQASAEVYAGFGSDSLGEDRFDAFVGALGMIHVLANPLHPGRGGSCPFVPLGVPSATQRIEGWIFGAT